MRVILNDKQFAMIQPSDNNGVMITIVNQSKSGQEGQVIQLGKEEFEKLTNAFIQFNIDCELAS